MQDIYLCCKTKLFLSNLNELFQNILQRIFFSSHYAGGTLGEICSSPNFNCLYSPIPSESPNQKLAQNCEPQTCSQKVGTKTSVEMTLAKPTIKPSTKSFHKRKIPEKHSKKHVLSRSKTNISSVNLSSEFRSPSSKRRSKLSLSSTNTEISINVPRSSVASSSKITTTPSLSGYGAVAKTVVSSTTTLSRSLANTTLCASNVAKPVKFDKSTKNESLDQNDASNFVKRTDPTLKATNNLIQQLLEQKMQHEKNAKSKPMPVSLQSTKNNRRTAREKDLIVQKKITKKRKEEQSVSVLEPKEKKAKVEFTEIPDEKAKVFIARSFKKT